MAWTRATRARAGAATCGARDGTGPCLVRARGGVAHAGVVGRLACVLVGRGGRRAVRARRVFDSGSGRQSTGKCGQRWGPWCEGLTWDGSGRQEARPGHAGCWVCAGLAMWPE